MRRDVEPPALPFKHWLSIQLIRHALRMPGSQLDTLADLGHGQVIYAICTPCRRTIQLDTARLITQYGRGLRITELRHRLTCSHCNARPRCIRIVYAIRPR